ncbi:MAG: FAD-dependent oxidoreductase [Candidatus Melainabacteria bacterium]|nr:FAD-dependent oxidoreductase [Candidatus Melainabacteria bacterium]
MLASNDKGQFDVVVIGAGAGGLVAASFAAGLGLNVGLVSDGAPGGECLWTGCVPSKALIHSASIAQVLRNYAGDPVACEKFPFKRAMEHMKKVRERVSHHDSVERVVQSGVKVITGRACFLDPYSVEVDGRKLSARKFIIATGGYQAIPPVEGLKEVGCLTHESILELKTAPTHLLIVGGGPVGVEYAQTMRRLGAHVTIVEMDDRLLNKEESETSEFVLKRLESEGVFVLFKSRLAQVRKAASKLEATIAREHGEVTVGCDHILVATGKTPNTASLELSKAEVEVTEKGFIKVDQHQRTSVKNIWACGDVCGSYQFTHYADHTARVAVMNACLGLPVKAEELVVPWCTFIDPEVASVGMKEAEAVRRFGKQGAVTLCYVLDDYDRTIIDDVAIGFVKAVLDRKGKILGATVVAQRAGELIHEFAMAMKAGWKITRLSSLIHVYPTMSGAIQNLSTQYYRVVVGQSWQSKLVKSWARLLR